MKKKTIDAQVQPVVILRCPDCNGMIAKPIHIKMTYYKPQISVEDNCYAPNATHINCPKCGRNREGNNEKQAIKKWNVR